MTADVLCEQDVLVPDWPAPPHVKAFMTTRAGGVSTGPFASLNLGRSAGDSPEAIAENRRRVTARLPQAPLWLSQVHGARVVEAAAAIARGLPESADAAYTKVANVPCAIMVADCLPVLFCDESGTTVAAAHAGWRGLAGGVLQATVAAMRVPSANVLAWMGPAIGPTAFEVGEDVQSAFVGNRADMDIAFQSRDGVAGKYWADIFLLARMTLAQVGVSRVYGGGVCTHSNPDRFFSYRREGTTGRMGAVIWRQ